MKICVLGFKGGAPQVIFRDERLGNIRRLMDAGVYGLLESVVPPASLPAWESFSASQDPGSLGLYGERNRADHSYNPPIAENSRTMDARAIWDHLAKKGKTSIVVDGNGIVGSRDSAVAKQYPAHAKEIRKDLLKDEVVGVSDRQWQIARRLLETEPWDYFQFIEGGLDRLQHGFWKDFDEKHVQFRPQNSNLNIIPQYYQWLDEQVGAVFELIDEETIVLIVSAYGVQRLDGLFAINQWLIQEGFLVLHEYPSKPTAFEKLAVDWNKTRAWSEADSGASIFFNVQGREAQGVVSAEQYGSLQDELRSRLQKITDNEGRPLQTLAFKPAEIYRNLRNIAPDLMVSLGGMFWRPVTSIGHPAICLHDEDQEQDSCNHSEYGFFILAAPNCPLRGEYEGARLLDMAPTLLDLAGYDIPESMQGKSLVAGMEKKAAQGGPDDDEAQRLIHDRLAGLGYI